MPDEDEPLRYAMLSVYFDSLGSQLETRGAPVIAVPPYVRPLALDDALAIFEKRGREDLLWDAYWRIVRAVPVEGWTERGVERRYPGAFVKRWGQKLADFDRRRRDVRADAQLFSAALQACASERWNEARALAGLLEDPADPEAPSAGLFNTLSAAALGVTAHDFVRDLADANGEQRKHTAVDLHKLQSEVGLNLNDFVEDLADALLFDDYRPAAAKPDGLSAMTTSCIVRQDTNTLTTTATVTALAHTKSFDVLTRAIDPLGWPKRSNVIADTAYLADRDDLDSAEETVALGQGFPKHDGPRYLFEEVDVRWGVDDVQTGQFRNILAIDKFTIDDGRITLPFSLYRSIDSRILWDSRAGGLLVDDGFIVARPVAEDLWRVTSRKILKFSDRTPYSNPPGWLDFGQMLNYFAPASVTWWLETEMYSARHPDYEDEGPPGLKSDGQTVRTA